MVSWVRCGNRLYRFLILVTFSYFVTSYYGLGSLKPPCELNIFVLHQQQNLERTFGTSKMHLTPPPRPLAKAAVRSKGVVLLLMISTHIVGSCYYTRFFVRKIGYINIVPKSVRRPSVRLPVRPSVRASVRPSVTFLVIVSSPKRLDLATSNLVGA